MSTESIQQLNAISNELADLLQKAEGIDQVNIRDALSAVNRVLIKNQVKSVDKMFR